jgi:lipoate-protein ligase A
MAADEALLETAARGIASLRFYAWSPATLSLGYFQPHSERLSDPLLAGLPWVRRPSGGGALVHHHEVTYALALPPGPPWQLRHRPWVRRMHGIIATALAQLGAPVVAVGDGEEKKLGEVLCFLHQTPGDLLFNSAKVVGSAQRRPRGALLQHGSILLSRSPHTPALPGLRDLATGARLSTEEVLPALCDAFADETIWRLEPDNWSADELGRIEAIRRDRYCRAEWNEKR